MDAEALSTLVLSIKKAARSSKPWYFWFCPKGEDGIAVLLLDKKAASLKKPSRAARKTAQVKISASGEVHATAEGMVFVDTEEKIKPARVEKLFKTQLAKVPELKKVASHLRKATMLTVAAFEAMDAPTALDVDHSAMFAALVSEIEAALPHITDAKKAKKFASRLSKAQKGFAKKPEKAIDALEDLLSDLADEAPTEDWDDIVARAKVAYKDARSRLGEESRSFAALGKQRKAALVVHKAGDDAIPLMRALIQACEQAQPDPTPSVEDQVETLVESVVETVATAIESSSSTLETEEEVEPEEDVETPLPLTALGGSWNTALIDARVALAKWRTTVKQLPGVRHDPRFADLAAALDDYDPIPDFPPALENAIAADDREASRAAAVDLRAQLDNDGGLQNLAKNRLAESGVHAPLQRALERIEAVLE